VGQEKNIINLSKTKITTERKKTTKKGKANMTADLVVFIFMLKQRTLDGAPNMGILLCC